MSKKRKILIGVGVAVLVLIVIGIATSGSEDQGVASPVAETNSPSQSTVPAAATAVPTEAPAKSLSKGTYKVGSDIEPGIYAGQVGTDVLGSCYWARMSGASGDFSELIANDNAQGQFYVEVQAEDKFFKIDCEITPLSDWPAPATPLVDLVQGTYLVGRDIAAGTYKGQAGTDVLESCYWARLGGLSDELRDLIANENAQGNYYVTVEQSDYALKTGCSLSLEP